MNPAKIVCARLEQTLITQVFMFRFKRSEFARIMPARRSPEGEGGTPETSYETSPARNSEKIEHRTAEYRMSNRRMSKCGFALGLRSQFGEVGLLSPFYKIDRIHSFDIRYS